MNRQSLSGLVALAWLLLALAPLQAADKLESQFFDSNGTRIHYVVVGEGEPVVLIHGFTANLQQNWNMPGIIDALKDDFQVIALDNRGHGRSDKPHEPEDYGMQMIEDPIRLLDHLGIEKAHFVGYSLGGFITGKLMTTFPDRVLTATLGGAGWNEPDSERMEFMTELAEALESGNGIAPLIKMLNPPGNPEPTDEQIKGLNMLVMLNNDPKALAAVIRGTEQWKVPEEVIRANKIPTLALIGEVDPLKDGVDALKSVMPDLNVVVIEGANHMDATSHPKFRESLLEFLHEHSQSEAEPVGAGN